MTKEKEFNYAEWILSRELSESDNDDGSEFNIEAEMLRQVIEGQYE